MSQAVKLSPSVIKKIEVTGKKFYVWDAGISGFGVRVTASGHKSFVLRVRVGGRKGRQIEETISEVKTPVTAEAVDKARSDAITRRAILRGDKNTDIMEKTFKEAVEDYLDHLRRVYNIPKPPKSDKIETVNKWPKHPRAVAYGLRRCVDFPPKKGDKNYEIWKKKGRAYHAGLGHLKFSALTDEQISNIISEIAKQSLSSAKNVRGYLSAMFNHYRKTSQGAIYNVVESTPKIKVRRQISTLNHAEMLFFDDVLQSIAMEGGKKSIQANACRTMLWTGTRVEELVTLKWDDDGALTSNFVDLYQGLIYFRRHKTDKDSGEATSVAITDFAHDALTQIKQSNYRPRDISNPFIFFSDWSKTGHICQKALNEFFKRHIVHVYREFDWPEHRQKLTLYNLRHSLVSHLLNDKQLPIYLVAQQMKHNDYRTTGGYHHKTPEALNVIRNAVGSPKNRY